MKRLKKQSIVVSSATFIIVLSLITPTSAAHYQPNLPTVAEIEGAHVSTGGGYQPFFYQHTELPEVVAHGSAIYLPMPITMIYPGPAVNPFEKRMVRASSLRSALRSLYYAAKEPSRGWGYIGIADAPTTTVKVTVDGKTRRVSVYALSMNWEGKEITASQSLARKRLRAAIDRLSALRGSSSSYSPTMIEGWVTSGIYLPGKTAKLSPPKPEIFNPDEQFENEIIWPLPSYSTDCMLIDASNFPKEANAATIWVSNGDRFKAMFRPVMPGEVGCE
jgi:hypothetical protein